MNILLSIKNYRDRKEKERLAGLMFRLEEQLVIVQENIGKLERLNQHNQGVIDRIDALGIPQETIVKEMFHDVVVKYDNGVKEVAENKEWIAKLLVAEDQLFVAIRQCENKIKSICDHLGIAM